MLGCFWNRPRLERDLAGALRPRAARAVSAHLARCGACRRERERLERLRTLLAASAPVPVEPDWSGFWPAVRARIEGPPQRPIRDPWWLPVWKPVWGHPRLAAGVVGVVVLALGLSLWPPPPGEVGPAWAGPVVVQDVSMPTPGRSVMVYSNQDADMTVIWIFAQEDEDDD